MSWIQIQSWLVRAGKFLGVPAAGGAYYVYTERNRWPKMVTRFEKGYLSEKHTSGEREEYFHREQTGAQVRLALQPAYSGQYYLIKGEVGSGKSRLIKEITLQFMEAAENDQTIGAPVYVLCSDGRIFSETLAQAVNFNFDEHINLNYFCQYLLGIRSAVSKVGTDKILRVLDAIEEAATCYRAKHNRPAVIILDSVDWIRHVQHGLTVLQEKAKLWADANLVKVIFVTNDEDTERILKGNFSSWSRAGTPITVGDLSKEEAMHFLQRKFLSSEDPNCEVISLNIAEEIYDEVGGRVIDLVLFRRGHLMGKSHKETASDLRIGLYERLLTVSKHPKAVQGLQKLLKSENHTMPLSEFQKCCGPEEVAFLCRSNLVKLEIPADRKQIMALFESKLVYQVVKESLQTLEV